MDCVLADIEEDFDSLKQVAEACFSDTPDAQLDSWFSFDYMREQVRAGRGVCIKAVANGQLLGMCYAQQENPINSLEGMEKWVIVFTGVLPGETGQGVGSLLLEKVEQEAKARGCRKMFVYTNADDKRVINYYQRNHYKDAGWIKDYQYGEGNSAVFLLKYL